MKKFYNISYTIDSIFRGYGYLGYTYPCVPEPWKPIILRLLRDIDRLVRPWYVSRILLNIVNLLATNGSVVYVRSWFWLRILESVTKSVRIHDIKDKYAGLRVYGSFTDAIQSLVDKAEEECEATCEKCGSMDDVQVYDTGWMYNWCRGCRGEE